MIQLPPLLIDQGQAYDALISWTRDGDVVDTSAWSGEITIKTAPKGDLVGTWAVDLTTPGDIGISLAADETATLPALARIGRFVTGVFQITLTEPDGPGQAFQGNVAVSGAV